MSTAQTLTPGNQTVNHEVNATCVPVRMDVIEEIAALAAGTERPARIWGNTDRATVAAEALWIFARRTGLDGRGDEAYAAVQDLIANLMHLCERKGMTGGEVTCALLANRAVMLNRLDSTYLEAFSAEPCCNILPRINNRPYEAGTDEPSFFLLLLFTFYSAST